ncbi:hypothetical protein [Thiothrix fructosivorans]|uniref:Uncharacterized protein n=1 Tax=Thiothrix fructosivorans TaxID=111770 RepID=A0A8B0SGY9_9GAMM|nr:hypothetical protein [Thiothrix fructosivorans]MBO0613927.1 hypothetical protein [Thiothrix fructosivorans]QTX10294.1 hypothetical protein J1836_017165 [Thiothrix fructosivorans]
MEINRGYSIKGKSKGKLRHWSVLFEKWSQGIDLYIDVTDGDVPYFYKERASVSFLAAAAWQCGWVAMQEFETEKRKPKGRYKAWKGRCDLFICSENRSDFIEAKYKQLSLNSKNLVENLDKVLADAVSDAHDSKCRQDINAVGVAFIPFYAHSKHEHEIDALVEEAISQIKITEADAWAWCFPDSMRRVASDNDYLNPGMIMLAKLAE